MPLPPPDLDDRDFNELVKEAKKTIENICPEWKDFSPGDPGRVLLELFAHLTETMIYRLNRLPEKAKHEFLNLMGVRRYPPSAAVVTLKFSRKDGSQKLIEIPACTQVSAQRKGGGAEPTIFVTAREATLAEKQDSVEVVAYHCEWVDGELLGLGTGLAGLTVKLNRPPVIADTGDGLDLVVGVEAKPWELGEGIERRPFGDKTYRVWTAVDSFGSPRRDECVYVADRYSGQISFAPAARIQAVDGLEDQPRALAGIPLAGREIRAWYRRGGGSAGNIAEPVAWTLKDDIPDVQLEATSTEQPRGGREEESEENVLVRGPLQIYRVGRAVTARDFEDVALASGAVARALAITPAELWKHAQPGTVEVLLVPVLPSDQRGQGQVTAAAFETARSEETRQKIEKALKARCPLGVHCSVRWAKMKTVSVSARVVVRRQENRTAAQRRVLDRLYRYINPLPTERYNLTGWRFGEKLYASHVYDAVQRERGMRWADRVKLTVDEAPIRPVRALAADHFQKDTWYATGGDTLFRSLNNGDGWEAAGRFEGEEVHLACANPKQAGLIVAVSHLSGQTRPHRIHVTRDCGESWAEGPDLTGHEVSFEVNAIGWTGSGEAPVLLATDEGLYELALTAGSTPNPVLVHPENQGLGLFAVATTYGMRGPVRVAVAAREKGGVWLSVEGGAPGTFKPIGLKGQDVQVLAVQYDHGRTWLWAGVSAAGPATGEGCFRLELVGSEIPNPEDWSALGKDWDGGSCRALAFAGTRILAATYHAGVLQMIDAGGQDPKWIKTDGRSGLPQTDSGIFLPVWAVAATETAVMAGTDEGVYRSRDEGKTYELASAQEFSDRVTLPPTWLFCSGEHQIEVVSEDEVKRD